MVEDKARGFSLIEVLAAVAILALVALPLLGMFTAAMQSGHAAQLQTLATLHAQEQMEKTIAEGPAGWGTLPRTTSGHVLCGSVANFFSFTTVVSDDNTGLVRITITINWTEARGPRSYRVVTLVE